MINTKHNRHYIARALGLTDLQYCEIVEQGGYRWLNRYFSLCGDMIKIMSYSEMFWKWWVNEWEIRDEHYVAHTKYGNLGLDVLQHFYADVHAIDRLIIRPNKWVIKEVNTMIKQDYVKTIAKHLKES